MTDEVKFIFKTLLKVPIIILVCYAILNLFSFFFIYFKALGASYVVMQVAVENNYLPATELKELYAYVDEWNDIPMCNNATIIVGKSGSTLYKVTEVSPGVPQTSATYGTADARRRKQYGNTVTCGVTCDYTIVWPLSHREQLEGAGLDSKIGTTGDTVEVAGVRGGANPGFKSETELDTLRKSKRAGLPITITYTVPGLKYYPDMITH